MSAVEPHCEPASRGRSQLCPDCKGITSVPARSRTLTLEQVIATHQATCPGRKAPRKEVSDGS